jgi:hypothetical protein
LLILLASHQAPFFVLPHPKQSNSACFVELLCCSRTLGA